MGVPNQVSEHLYTCNIPLCGTYYIPTVDDKIMYTKNSEKALRVDALWDDEAGVWSASSTDIEGLAIEAVTKEALIARLKAVIPDLLELNHASSNRVPSIDLIVSGHQNFRLAS